MPFIEVTGVPKTVTQERIEKIFSKYGTITEIIKSKKEAGKYIIQYSNHLEAQDACELDYMTLDNRTIQVFIRKDGKPVKIENYKKPLFTIKEILVILAVFMISAITHLPNLEFPNEVVFDEVHFGGFVTDYMNGVRFFDIHPPLGKLLYAGYAKLVGYNGHFNYSAVSEGKLHNYDTDFYVKLRYFPCICGTLIAPILTASLILRFQNLPISFMVGFIFAIDFTSIVQSRFILTDAIVYLFVALTIFFSCLLYHRESWTTIFFQALFGSAAFCSKFAAGSCLVIVGFVNFNLVMRRKHGFLVLIVRGVFCVAILVIMLFTTVYIHLKITPIVGYGDQYADPSFRTWPMFTQIKNLIYLMYVYNRDLEFTHPYSSKWYEWPVFAATPTLIYSDDGLTKIICIFNNPVTVFVSAVGPILAAFVGKYEWVLAYACSYFPFILVSRITWTYHYEVALMFGICCYGFVLSKLGRGVMYTFITITIVLATAAYAFYFQWLYGIKQTVPQLRTRTIWPAARKMWSIDW